MQIGKIALILFLILCSCKTNERINKKRCLVRIEIENNYSDSVFESYFKKLFMYEDCIEHAYARISNESNSAITVNLLFNSLLWTSNKRVFYKNALAWKTFTPDYFGESNDVTIESHKSKVFPIGERCWFYNNIDSFEFIYPIKLDSFYNSLYLKGSVLEDSIIFVHSRFGDCIFE